MSEGRVTGSVELRPLRLGLVIPPGRLDALERAIDAASISWAGSSFPLISTAWEERRIRQIAVGMGIDALVSCEEDPRCQDLTKMDGFAWLGFGSPVDHQEHGDRLVDLSTIIAGPGRASLEAEPLLLPRWEDDDDLSACFKVLFGQVSQSSEYEREVGTALSRAFRTIPIPLNGEIPGDLSANAGPLGVGLLETQQMGSWWESGIVVIDPRSPDDLARFWNLRAAGMIVLPWPEPFDERLATYTLARLSALPAGRWAREGEEQLTIFVSPNELPGDLSSVLEAESIRAFTASPDLRDNVRGGSGIATRFSTFFEVAVEDGSHPRIRVPLPPAGLGDAQPLRPRQYCAARITIHSEFGLRERTSFQAPAVRALSPALRSAVEPLAPIVRGMGDGVVMACTVGGEKELPLRANDGPTLIIELLRQAGLAAATSDAGRWSSRIVDLLGGASSSLSAQPAVREVLTASAREAGAQPGHLMQVARESAGPWKDQVWPRAGSVPYAKQVVGSLAARRLIETLLAYHCSACGLPQRASPDQIRPILTCGDCDNQTPLGLELIRGAGWHLRTRALLNRSRLWSVFPIASALFLLGRLESKGGASNLLYALGLDIGPSGDSFEIDLAAFLHTRGGPVLLIGESKGRSGNFDDADIAHLEAVQTAVRDLGIECVIAVATSSESLSPAGIARLRASAARFLFSLDIGLGGGSHVNLPLVLTREALTTPELHKEHPLTRAGRTVDIHKLAQWTCERELGLAGHGDPATRTLEWNPVEGAPDADS